MNKKNRFLVYPFFAFILVSIFAGSCTKADTAAPEILLPAVTSGTVSAVTLDSATCTGEMISDGGSVLSPRGICYSTTPNPTITDTTGIVSIVQGGTGVGAFTVYLTGLTAATTYYAKAFASNSAGAVYGTEMTFTTLPLAIAANYHGGKIAYIDGAGQHGFIAAPADSIAKQWYNGLDTVTTATGTLIGDGTHNTTVIIAAQRSGVYAASVCDVLVLNGYSDWYLPSKDELDQLFINRNAIGGFDILSSYWTSSESDVSQAWAQFFGDGSQSIALKSSTYNVRPVRNF